jgi:hypothetical protein
MQDLGEIGNMADNDAIWEIRGKAVQAYVNVEQNLSRLFAGLTGMAPDIANLVFFKISETSRRNDILRELLGIKFSGKYMIFIRGWPR